MCYMQDILESKLSVKVIINLHTLHTAKHVYFPFALYRISLGHVDLIYRGSAIKVH